MRLEGIVSFRTLRRLLLEPTRHLARVRGVAASFGSPRLETQRRPGIGGVCDALTLPSLVSVRSGSRVCVRQARLGSRGAAVSALACRARRAASLAARPTNPRRWAPPETFEPRRWAISPEEAADHSRPTACKLLRDELRAIRQTLDMPPEALSGLTRNGLLAAHGLRLRQLERWLWPFYAAREIKRMIA